MRGQEAEDGEPAPERHDAPGNGEEAGAGPTEVTPDHPAVRARNVEPDDLFYHGVIATVNWSRGTGVVRSGNGREIPFDFQFVTMLGGRRQIEHLLPGMRIGFDVGWTSKGLRITAIKIYD
jgi:hypothetical protein